MVCGDRIADFIWNRIVNVRVGFYLNNYSMKYILLAAIVCLLVGSTQGLTFYQYNFNTVTNIGTNIPYYNLGYIYGGNTIMVKITLVGTSAMNINSLIVVLRDINNARPALTAAAACTSGALTCQLVYDIPAADSDTYTLKITEATHPADNAGGTTSAFQFYYLDVTSYLTSSGGPSNSSAVITTLKKSTEVVRDRITKLIYVGSTGQKLKFEMWPVADLAATTNSNMFLYTAGSPTDSNSNYPISTGTNLFGDNTLFGTPTFNNNLMRIDQSTATSTLAIGFYILVITSATPDQNPVIIRYDSDSYACPYDAAYPDTYANMQPCNQAVANQQGFPCVNYDTVNLQCLTCFTGYELVNGSCVYNDTCPDRFHFAFGTCLPVSDLCDTYDAFTGYCKTCKNNASTIDGFGVCKAIPVVCADRQYVVNNTCQNVSALCATWSNDTGLCTSCISGYTLLTNGTCTPTVIVCADNQYLVGTTCTDIPKECASFDKVAHRCLTCIRGWWPSSLGVCQQIICPPAEVPSTYGFFCIKVSPLCQTWDNITGDCITCNNKDATVINGKCRLVTNPLAGCQERARLGYGPCSNALLNCQLYDLITKNCYECVKDYFFDYKGECTLKNRVCEADEVSILGYCHQMPPNCDKVDTKGLCSSCKTGYKNVFGLCIKVETCPGNQYMSASGVCVDVTPGCAAFNPTTGVCLTCSDGSPATNGLCCASGQNAFKGQCISSVSYRQIKEAADQAVVPTCVGYHPTMGHCIECNGNFQVSPINPTRCV